VMIYMHVAMGVATVWMGVVHPIFARQCSRDWCRLDEFGGMRKGQVRHFPTLIANWPSVDLPELPTSFPSLMYILRPLWTRRPFPHPSPPIVQATF